MLLQPAYHAGCVKQHCFDRVEQLNLSNRQDLLGVECQNNQLSTLTLAGCSKLRVVECQNNQLTNLDIDTCSELVSLYCYENQLTELDVSHNTKLRILECYGQKNGKGWIVLKLTQSQYDKHESDNGNSWFAPEDVVDSKV